MKKLFFTLLISSYVFANSLSFTLPNDKIITSYISTCEDGGKLFLRNSYGGDSEYKLSQDIDCQKAKAKFALLGLSNPDTGEIYQLRVTINTNRMVTLEIAQN